MASSAILVIKHGALGDIILATAAFAAIRGQHPAAHITLLTTAPYAELMAPSPYFNDIWIDEKPGLLDVSGIRELRARLNSKQWEWIYDFQNSARTLRYAWLLKRPWPRISNASRWASHPRPRYDITQHALANLRAQLMGAGIAMGDTPDVSWLTAKLISHPSRESSKSPLDSDDSTLITSRYALLVPGGAAHRPEKRWPAERYTQLAKRLVGRGIMPVLIGTNAEASVLSAIATQVPEAVNLCGKTSIAQLADLARGAALAVGNDTGPMHVIAASNCPSTVLFSHASDPVRSAPLGAQVSVLRAENLAELSVEAVLGSLTARA